MSRVRAEFLDDKAIVHYSLPKTDGFADYESSIDVPYGSISRLRPVPSALLNCDHFICCEEVFVPKTGLTVVFIFCIWEAHYPGSNTQGIYGPYLKTQTAPAPKITKTEAEAQGTEEETNDEEEEQESPPYAESNPQEGFGCGTAALLLTANAIVTGIYYALR